jgi:hypothetical protein
VKREVEKGEEEMVVEKKQCQGRSTWKLMAAAREPSSLSAGVTLLLVGSDEVGFTYCSKTYFYSPVPVTLPICLEHGIGLMEVSTTVHIQQSIKFS